MGRQGHRGAKRPNGGADMALLGGLLQPPQVAPIIDTCYQVEGSLGQPGLIRYCSAKKPSLPGDDDGINR
ncbi:hypothetical protein SLEP1_g52034 [Rubroshorea leprosula]|uniref:Uncharacterized protein n=1 Tax=Rubroshorea leprosula TaxID=152421 RepID=A0AAV5M525_9ROSI|nr:hypothetical protein SLEP1_g52034 [Rubroshorea leprosula]